MRFFDNSTNDFAEEITLHAEGDVDLEINPESEFDEDTNIVPFGEFQYQEGTHIIDGMEIYYSGDDVSDDAVETIRIDKLTVSHVFRFLSPKVTQVVQKYTCGDCRNDFRHVFS